MKARTKKKKKEKIEIIHCIKNGITNSRVIGKLINKPKSIVMLLLGENVAPDVKTRHRHDNHFRLNAKRILISFAFFSLPDDNFDK